jgi:hypothetical protein
MPEVMASWLRLTRPPRIRGGAASPMYIGTVIEADPTARPMTTLATSSTAKVGVNAASSTPRMKTSAVIRIVGRRPMWSASRAAPMAPIAAPTSSRLVTSSSWNEVMCGKSSFRNSSAPDTTPVS